MRRILLTSALVTCMVCTGMSQNVFNISDPIVRYDKTKPLGSAQNPNPAMPGLQKWVSTPTSGVSTGSSTWDASSFKAYLLNNVHGRMPFRVKFPKSYTNPDSAAKRYPIMLFLHGAGEVGCPSNNGIYNNEKQLALGGSLFRDRVDNNLFDGFLLYPQLINNDGCWGAWGTAASSVYNSLFTMIDSMAKYIRVDIDRVLITGLSGGGYGAWRCAESYSQRTAKIMPSAAAGGTNARDAFVHIPIWFATGGKDPDPSPAQADYAYNRMKEIGANIRYTRYDNLGHAVWNDHWKEPDFVPEMNDVHKANPLVFFQHNEFCPNQAINARLGITAGFYAYEWQRDGVTIATRTGTVNTILQPAHVISFTGNEITVKSYGTYRVRFRRTASFAWSVFSPKPVIVKTKDVTQTAAITINGTRSKVLPATDGSTTVPLGLPSGFINYQWFRVSDNVQVGNSQIFNAPPGVYKARYSEQFGCGTNFSPDFTVVNASGSPQPDAVTSVTAVPLSKTSVRLNWTQGNGETGLEVYRATQAGGPYVFVALTAADAVTYTDAALQSGTTYYYVIRAVSGTGAAAPSGETTARTLSDNTLPSAPGNLEYRGSTSSTVLLRWNASSDADGIKRYDIYANGERMFSTTATIFNVFNLESDKSYAFTVKSVDNNNNESAPSNQITGYTHQQGVNYKYYTTATEWTALPNFNALTPAKTGTTDSVNINNTTIRTLTQRYGFVWQGSIYIPVTAAYTFETISDDGSKLYIDVPYTHTATALVSNDGVHGAQSRTGTITLSQGYHSIAVTYFQGLGGSDMQLFWSNNAGMPRQRIQKNFIALSPGTLTGVPAVPGSPAATALAYNKIRVSWTDNSTNETGFEIVRSTSSGGTYVPVGTAPAGATSFADTPVNASTTYYYKIKAVAGSSESVFTAVASATTPAAPATPAAPSQLQAAGSSGNAVSLTWSDNSANETGFRIYRATDGINFALVNTVPPNVNAYTDNTAASQVTYQYYIAGFNASGEGTRSNIVTVKAGNQAPVIGALANLFVKTGATATEDFTAIDNSGEEVTVAISNRPSFLSISSLGGGNFRLAASPTLNNVGWYTISVVATDENGASSTQQITVSVADDKTRSVFINFGAVGKTAPVPWNNWLGNRGTGTVIANLKDENNATTSFAVTTQNPWSSTTVMGHISGNNSGIVPDAVLESGIMDNAAPKQILVSGLNPAMRYSLAFIGSQNEGVPATTSYAAGGQTAIMDARYNTTRAATLSDLVPDALGQILVTATRTGATVFSFLNAMIIEEYAAASAPLNPQRLYAEPLDRNRVSLTWSDRTNIEDAVNGYELQRANDSMFTQGLTSIALPANTTSYINTGLQPNTRYWYRVRANSVGTSSPFSNQFVVVTPASIVSVNFNTTVPNGPVPWNNLVATSTVTFAAGNFIDQSGAQSGIGIRLEEVFNGEFTAGVSTGNNSGIVPDNVLLSDYWIDKLQLAQFRLTGLNQSRRYRIGFFGSSSSTGWFRGNYTASYTVNGKTVYLNSWMNSTKIVYVSDLVPDPGGELVLKFSTTAIADWAFNGGLVIQEYNDATGGSMQYMSNSVLDTTLARATPAAALPDDVQVMMYPNPFRSEVNMDFVNSAAGNKVSAEIYDLHGRLVGRQNYVQLPAGRNTIRVRAPKTGGSGVYMIGLRVNGKLVKAVKMLRNID